MYLRVLLIFCQNGTDSVNYVYYVIESTLCMIRSYKLDPLLVGLKYVGLHEKHFDMGLYKITEINCEQILKK